MHLEAPIAPGWSWDQVMDFCGAFAEVLAMHALDKYVPSMSKAKRDDRIFVDLLRNARGATSLCSWSLHARERASVATPLRWDELGKTTSPGMYTMARALQRVNRLRQDPWVGMGEIGQALPG